VIVGADSRSTYGNLIGDKNSMKLHKLTDSIYAAGAGTAADLRHVCYTHHTHCIALDIFIFQGDQNDICRIEIV
jgi:ATP-dependent protease HslVU (ClpYQ) peptidase subunit